MRLAAFSVALWLVAGLQPGLAANAPDASSSLDSIRNLVQQDRTSEAEIRLRQVLAEHGTTDDLEMATILDLFVECRLRAGKAGHSETLEMAQQAVSIKEKLGATPADLATSLHNLARVRYAQGHFAAAHHHYTQLVAAREKRLGPHSLDLASNLTTLALSITEIGDWREAVPLLQRALEIQKETSDSTAMARTLANLARVKDHLGEKDGGDLVEKSLSMYRRSFAGEPCREALATEDLARLLDEMGKPREALALIERSRTLWAEGAGPDHPFAQRGALLEASLLFRLGDLEKARDLYARVLPMFESGSDAQPRELASAWADYAEVEGRLGNVKAAAWISARAEASSEKDPTLVSPEKAAFALRKALLLARSGSVREALDAALISESLYRESIRISGHTLPERQALEVASARTKALDLALTLGLSVKDGPSQHRIYDAVIRSRAVVLDEMAVRNRTLSELDRPWVAELQDAFTRANEEYSHLALEGPSGLDETAYRKALAGKAEAKDGAEAALAARSVVFRKELTRSRASVDEVRQALPDHGVLLSFTRFQHVPLDAGSQTDGDTWYAAFVLPRTSPDPVFIPIGPARTIDALVKSWGEEISRDPGSPARESEMRYRRAGAALRRSIWDPIRRDIGTAAILFVVPDGELHAVALAALPDRGDGFLLEHDPSIQYLSSERDLISSSPPGDSNELLALGGIDFDTSLPNQADDGSVAASRLENFGVVHHFRGDRSHCRAFQAIRFEALPASGREIEDIAAIWTHASAAPDSFLRLTGRNATEDSFKSLASRCRVLHLATHGFFLGNECREVPSGGRGIGELAVDPSHDTGPANPLVLSGLALAGANQRSSASAGQDDGILTAEEIATLDLHRVEWAVLSGCETGVGEFRAGEGVFGLRRAFEVAGTRTLIMSLWPVEDEATREWMKALYTARFQGKQSTVDAVRSAAISVLLERRQAGRTTHPFFWGGFVAAGDWR